MAFVEQHVALPKLVGAPAYSRPRRPVEASPRPIDPDDYPLEAEMSDEDRQVLVEAGWLVHSVAAPPELPLRPLASARS